MAYKFQKNLTFILYVAIISLLPFVIFEGAMHALLYNPSLLKHTPWTIDKIVWAISRQDWQPIQHHSANAQYDPGLFYTLRPGHSTYSRYGFFRDTKYDVNRMGLRDDEASLDKPEVVVVGDSYAMGWGVEQNETFAQRIEKMTGLKTLDAGISSYGTVREMKMLDRIDTNAMKLLVIQYCRNDINENKTFSDKGMLPVSSEETYREICEKEERGLRYYPGKYASLAMGFYLRKWQKPDFEDSPQSVHAEYFLNALLRAGKTDLSETQVIVLGAADFCEALREKIRLTDVPEWVRKIIILDVFSRTTPDMEIPIDFHWNAKGHDFVAREIIQMNFAASDGA